MTCYWDSIYSQLDLEDYKFIGVERPSNIEGLVRLMKLKNKFVNNVTWQNSHLSSNEKREHYTAVDVYDLKGIYNGHLTSVCDSFLLLLCEIFCLSVEHKYLNTPIMYENKNKSRKTLKFRSNRGHFQNAGKPVKSAQTRLDRIREKAIQNSAARNTKIISNQQNNTNRKILPIAGQTEKRPSWRADPEGFKIWRQRMRSMNIR